MKAQTHAVRQDVMRGVRWGAILVLALLLSVAIYRIFVVTPAVASPAAAAKVDSSVPQPVVPVVEVKAEDVPQAAAEAAVKPAPVVIQKSPHAEVPGPPAVKAGHEQRPIPVPQAVNRFAPAPEPAAIRTTVVEGTLPDANVTPGAEVVASPTGAAGAALAPPPDKKPGATTKIVRGVGRMLRLGRKDDPGKQQ